MESVDSNGDAGVSEIEQCRAPKCIEVTQYGAHLSPAWALTASKLARGPACCAEPLIRKHQPACKPGSVGHRLLAQAIRDGHSSGAMLAHGLEQPTRTASLTLPCGVIACANSPRCRPYSVLLPVWFAMPFPLPDTRCALTAPFHPCSVRRRSGSFSVALSLGSPPPDVIRHRMSMEPGLSSPAAFRQCGSGRPAD